MVYRDCLCNKILIYETIRQFCHSRDDSPARKRGCGGHAKDLHLPASPGETLRNRRAKKSRVIKPGFQCVLVNQIDDFSASALSVCSQVNSGSERPKCP